MSTVQDLGMPPSVARAVRSALTGRFGCVLLDLGVSPDRAERLRRVAGPNPAPVRALRLAGYLAWRLFLRRSGATGLLQPSWLSQPAPPAPPLSEHASKLKTRLSRLLER